MRLIGTRAPVRCCSEYAMALKKSYNGEYDNLLYYYWFFYNMIQHVRARARALLVR